MKLRSAPCVLLAFFLSCVSHLGSTGRCWKKDCDAAFGSVGLLAPPEERRSSRHSSGDVGALE